MATFRLRYSSDSPSIELSAVLFDMDGLLIDSEGLSIDSWRKVMLEQFSVIVPNRELHTLFGLRIIDGAAFFIEKYQLPVTIDDLMEKRNAIMFASVRASLRLMPGAREIVQWLQCHDIPIALATSGQKQYVQTCLEVTGLDPFFSIRVTGDDIAKGKPGPEIYLKTASLLQIEPIKCLVLEDAPYGVVAGLAANMKVISVPNDLTKSMHFPPVIAQATSLLEGLTWLWES